MLASSRRVVFALARFRHAGVIGAAIGVEFPVPISAVTVRRLTDFEIVGRRPKISFLCVMVPRSQNTS